ncbi:12058_t:CDS:2, partial [Racocetra fulgida]
MVKSSLSKDQNEKAETLGLTLTTFKDIEKLGSTSKLECVVAEFFVGPVTQTILDFFRITVGCQVIQAYGLTQCSGAVTMNAFYDYYSIDQNGHDSHTGGPLACNEIKLINYEERGYTVEDVPNPRGE